jgi:hypothetical protein
MRTKEEACLIFTTHDLDSEDTLETASNSSDRTSSITTDINHVVNVDTVSSKLQDTTTVPKTPSYEPTTSPSTPCKLPQQLPSTPSIPKILCTPTSTSSLIPETPSSRKRLLSPRPFWQVGAAKFTKTLRRAASFASFGERSVDGDYVEDERRVSSDPVLESPRKYNRLYHQATVTSSGLQPEMAFTSDKIALKPSPTDQSPTPKSVINLEVQPKPPCRPMKRHSKSPLSGLQEVRASIVSTSSDLSAQWYRSPRERLGLFLTVTKRGSAPWECQTDNTTPGPIEDQETVTILGSKRSWRTLWLGTMKKAS